MKIRTQLIITMLLFSIILVVITVSTIIVNQLTAKATEQEKIASSIAEGANDLSYLANDYLVYREPQQLKRWQTKFASFSNQVTRLSLHKPEQQAIIRNIRANQQRLKEVFDSAASHVGRSPQNQSAVLDPAFFQVSWSRMAVQSQGLISDASRMSQILHQQTDKLREIRTMLLYLIVVLFGLFLLVSYMLTYRRILKSIATLQAGTAVIGSGNLDFKIEEKKNDEIGDLSHAFNQMTTNLKDVTASRKELEREITERKKAEVGLREAHDRATWLARFPEQNPNPVMRASSDGTVLYRNPASSKFPGWKCEVGHRLQNDLVPLFDRAMAEGKELQWDAEIEGRVYFIWIAPVPEERYANIYARDITERKRAEVALHESVQRFKAISTSTPDHLLVQDRELRYELVINPQFGLTEQDMIGKTDHDILSKEDADKLTRIKRQVLETGNPVHLEMPLISTKREQQFFDGSYIAKFDEKGQIDGLIGYFRNVTERKRMEEELRQSEEKSRLLIKHAPSMLYEIDFHRPAFKSVNDVMCQFLGYSREELLATNPFDLLDEEGKALFRDRIRRKFAGEEITDSVEYKSKTRDGRQVHGVLNISFTYKDGKPEGAVVVAHDITERKQAEEALKKRSAELQGLAETLEQRIQERTKELAEANQALRQLSIRLLSAQEEERKRVAGEIHDSMGSCLSGIKFKVESALEEIAKTPKAATRSLNSIVPVIQEAIEECRRIQMDLRPSMLDDLGLLPTLSWFFRRFQTIYSAIHVEQDVTIQESELPNSLKIVVYRVIQEAMNNAAKHSKADLVRVSLQKAHNKMELSVKDNGCGFSVQQRLFLEASKRGLGLTSMRERTELSGGSFAMESVEGKGTIIRASWSI